MEVVKEGEWEKRGRAESGHRRRQAVEGAVAEEAVPDVRSSTGRRRRHSSREGCARDLGNCLCYGGTSYPLGSYFLSSICVAGVGAVNA